MRTQIHGLVFSLLCYKGGTDVLPAPWGGAGGEGTCLHGGWDMTFELGLMRRSLLYGEAGKGIKGRGNKVREAWRVWCRLRMFCYERRELGVGTGGR